MASTDDGGLVSRGGTGMVSDMSTWSLTCGSSVWLVEEAKTTQLDGNRVGGPKATGCRGAPSRIGTIRRNTSTSRLASSFRLITVECLALSLSLSLAKASTVRSSRAPLPHCCPRLLAARTHSKRQQPSTACPCETQLSRLRHARRRMMAQSSAPGAAVPSAWLLTSPPPPTDWIPARFTSCVARALPPVFDASSTETVPDPASAPHAKQNPALWLWTGSTLLCLARRGSTLGFGNISRLVGRSKRDTRKGRGKEGMNIVSDQDFHTTIPGTYSAMRDAPTAWAAFPDQWTDR